MFCLFVCWVASSLRKLTLVFFSRIDLPCFDSTPELLEPVLFLTPDWIMAMT